MSLCDLEMREVGPPGAVALPMTSSIDFDYSIFGNVVSFPCLMTSSAGSRVDVPWL